ncbi:MAG: hypothetical protein K2X87_09170 [Gemmataceae bacterium]|nr:hypothetical protein [Gemmataceae bacterium]
MPLADYAAYKAAVAAALEYGFYKSTSALGSSGRPACMYANANEAGAAPTTAVACDAATVGAMLGRQTTTATTNPLYLAQVEVASGTAQSTVAMMLCDRLSHQGGLVGNVATAQTTNLPTAALTRYTSGAGVMAALEVYTAIGTGGSTVSVSYTNQAGTSGRTSKPVVIGATGANAATQFFPLPLQDGDTGVRSVESVTMAAATGTAGNMGVTLYKPLLILPGVAAATNLSGPLHWDGVICGGQKLIEYDDNCCLMMVTVGALGAQVQTTLVGSVSLIEAA